MGKGKYYLPRKPFDASKLLKASQDHIERQLDPKSRLTNEQLNTDRLQDPTSTGKYYLPQNVRSKNIQNAVSATFIIGEVGSAFLVDELEPVSKTV